MKITVRRVRRVVTVRVKNKQPRVEELSPAPVSLCSRVSSLSSQLGMTAGWQQWSARIPKLTVPKGCTFQPVPPFGGAVVRFCICKDKEQVSVYLDAHGCLGAMSKPYWEAYPIDGDNKRYYFDEWPDMMKDIEKELRKRK